jgi:hypothetical protein
MGASHGFLFLSHHPKRLASKLDEEDVVNAFSDAVRCLTYVHHMRGDRKWVQAYLAATGRRPCTRDVARRRNAEQCTWTGETCENYIWMCSAALEIYAQHPGRLAPSALVHVQWFVANAPFASPSRVVLPTLFPMPPDGKPDDGVRTLRGRASAARRYYKSVCARRTHTMRTGRSGTRS